MKVQGVPVLFRDHALPASECYPVFPSLLPSREVFRQRYRATFATCREQLDAVLRLRYDVFNLELGEGLESSVETHRDRDEFDHVCHHLMVIDNPESSVIGTYRMQTSGMAACYRGFYSAGEFDLSGMPAAILENAVEVGWTCIARAHRNTVVLLLLWKGLTNYLSRTGTRYLFGCCSLPTQNPADGLAVLRYFERSGHMHPSLRVVPRAGWECRVTSSWPMPGDAALTPLLRLYLRYGAKVCSLPALNRHFKTTDFLVLLDLAALCGETRRRFFADDVF